MLINTLVSITNQALAGETLLYSQLEPLYDSAIDKINADLNACFPTFSEHRSTSGNTQEYNYFPDKYLRSVVVPGAVSEFYTIDEEGAQVAETFMMLFREGLFLMKRDYSESIPIMFQAENRGFLSSPTSAKEGCGVFLNPDIRYYEGPKGDRGESGLSPHVGANGNWHIGVNDMGIPAQGPTGAPGFSPFVGPNGNWVTLAGDTGIKAQGPKGDKGDQGIQGPKGDKGSTGPKGDKGDKGDTPIYETLFVHVSSINGDDETGDGTKEKPYKTLEKAHWSSLHNQHLSKICYMFEEGSVFDGDITSTHYGAYHTYVELRCYRKEGATTVPSAVPVVMRDLHLYTSAGTRAVLHINCSLDLTGSASFGFFSYVTMASSYVPSLDYTLNIQSGFLTAHHCGYVHMSNVTLLGTTRRCRIRNSTVHFTRTNTVASNIKNLEVDGGLAISPAAVFEDTAVSLSNGGQLITEPLATKSDVHALEDTADELQAQIDIRVSESSEKHVVYGTINDRDYGEEQDLYPQEVWDTFNTSTVSGVTFTVDKAAHTITANGTATADINKEYVIPDLELGTDKRFFSCPVNGIGVVQFQIRIDGQWGPVYPMIFDTGFGVDIGTEGKHDEIILIIKNGTVCNNLVFKPRYRTYVSKSGAQADNHALIPYSQQNIPNSLVQRDDEGNINGLSAKGLLQYTIAAPSSVNKERADLILGTEDPAQEINDAIEMLHNARGENTDIAIRIDFMGGVIDVGEKRDGSAIVIPMGYDNIHLYGNRVKITGDVSDPEGLTYYSILENRADNIIVNGFEVFNSSSTGLYNTGYNCIISGNTCGGDEDCLYNNGDACIITGNFCSGSGDGLYNVGISCTMAGNICDVRKYGLYNNGYNCIISGNTCNSSDYNGLYNNSIDTTDKCVIIGNICRNGGISVNTGTCLPATQLAMADVNTGTVTLRP